MRTDPDASTPVKSPRNKGVGYRVRIAGIYSRVIVTRMIVALHVGEFSNVTLSESRT